MKSAKAKLAQDEALLINYQRDVTRLEPLTRERAAQQRAAMKGDQAAIDGAKLNLSYTEIKTPIGGGIIGMLNVTAGNLVNAGQSTTLTTISSFDPIYVHLNLRRKAAIGMGHHRFPWTWCSRMGAPSPIAA